MQIFMCRRSLDLNKKLKIKIGAFNNSDAKNSQINQTLDDKQKSFLTYVGDSIQHAYYPSAVVDTSLIPEKFCMKRSITIRVRE